MPKDTRKAELYQCAIDEDLSLDMQTALAVLAQKHGCKTCGEIVAHAMDATQTLAKRMNVRVDAHWCQTTPDTPPLAEDN